MSEEEGSTESPAKWKAVCDRMFPGEMAMVAKPRVHSFLLRD